MPGSPYLTKEIDDVAKDADVLDPERFGFHLSRRNLRCRVGDDACLHCLLYPQCNHEKITRHRHT
jgi:hypothetical protein